MRRLELGPHRGMALLISLTFPLWGCPPILDGEACISDCNCPNDQSCVFAPGASAGACQTGTNTCSTSGDGGDQPDAGDAGDGGPIPDAGDAGGSNNPFQGVVVLNGGAVPPSTAKVYGFADGLPIPNASGIYTSADVVALTNNQGDFVSPGPVPPPTGTGYRFVGVYDTKGHGDYSVDDPGTFSQLSADSLAPGSIQADSMRLDVQTSTCFSITTDLGQFDLGAGTTYFLGVGAIAVDTRTGTPLVSQTDLDAVGATFDAGTALPPGGGFPGDGILSLEPVPVVPGFGITDSWFYPNTSTKGVVGPLSNSGTFFITLTDGSHGQPQYPSGACSVAYQPPPGFPGNIAINGMDGGSNTPDAGVLWQTNISSGGPGTHDRVSWTDFSGVMSPDVMYLADFVAILGPLPDGGTQQLYPDGGQVTFASPPLDIAAAIVPPNLCDQGTKQSCALEVTTFYTDTHKSRAIAIEGGTTLLPFQRATLIPTP